MKRKTKRLPSHRIQLEKLKLKIYYLIVLIRFLVLLQLFLSRYHERF
jgi:hypothetical protein